MIIRYLWCPNHYLCQLKNFVTYFSDTKKYLQSSFHRELETRKKSNRSANKLYKLNSVAIFDLTAAWASRKNNFLLRLC